MWHWVMNRQAGQCLDVIGGNPNAGAPVGVRPCDFRSKWKLTPGEVPGYWRVQTQHSGMCLNVASGSLEPGAQIIQYPCGSPASPYRNDQWQLLPNRDGFFQLQNLQSALCLDKAGNNNAVQWDCHTGHWQQWLFLPLGF
jgi:hypothetical protein